MDMAKQNRQKVMDNKALKKEMQGGRVIKEKFQEEKQRKIPPLVAQNGNQKLTLKAFAEKQLVVQSGSAGVGKTELACWWASKQWLSGNVENIIITRPHKHLGDDYGAVKGNDAEKLLPFVMPIIMKLKRYLGTSILKNNFRMAGLMIYFQMLRVSRLSQLRKFKD